MTGTPPAGNSNDEARRFLVQDPHPVLLSGATRKNLTADEFDTRFDQVFIYEGPNINVRSSSARSRPAAARPPPPPQLSRHRASAAGEHYRGRGHAPPPDELARAVPAGDPQRQDRLRGRRVDGTVRRARVGRPREPTRVSQI